MIRFFKKTFDIFGKMPLCNLKVERGFYIGSFCFPLCVRCTAIIVGILIPVIANIFLCKKQKARLLYLWFMLIIPCLIDGVLQYFFYIESTNLRRFVLGLLSGLGIGKIILFLKEYLYKILKI